MSDSIGRTLFKLAFEVSPIILSDGVATGIPGGYLPIVAITESVNFATGLLSGGTDLSLDDFFAHFQPVQGGSLISFQVGKYPFANQAVAANAIIAQPLNVSMLMKCPAKGAGGYLTKLATMQALQAVLSKHSILGGTYVVVTPAYVYTNCLLTGMRDVTGGEGAQVQTQWLLDFEQPLVTLQQASQAQNSAMSKLTGGLPWDGSLSGAGQTPGNLLSGASPVTAPSSLNLTGTAVSGPFGTPMIGSTP